MTFKNQLSTFRPIRTFAVTVTYGSRYHLLEQVVSAALTNGVDKVIVVDNGSADASREAIRKLEMDSGGRVTIVALEDNCGSAGGFKAGLKYAQTHSECDYVWLLDDDNQPADNALTELFRQYSELSRVIEMDRLALVSLRGDWDEHKKIAHGVPIKNVFPRSSSFLGYHILTPPRILANFWNRNRQIDEQSITIPPIEIPFGPYGGLFFHKGLISKLGYPNELFFLYNDDTEYTYRLTNNGGKLFLVSSSVVNDLDRAWQVLNNGESFFSHFLIANSDLRIYYVARNQSYLESHIWMRNLTVYTLNKWAFFFFLSLFAMKHRQWRRVLLIARAVREGRLGKLGRLKDLENTQKPYH